MSTIHAIFEEGVFRPREPVQLPEGSEVEFEPRIVPTLDENGQALSRVYEILAKRFESGESDVSERHGEGHRR
jgi:predicted DNA-binding antitoxin AbrB/MazE fold protein